jgi:hypothetical protein
MKFKALLLGTAATFAFAGGNAVAADLSVAEPVDYVRVCDAFGSGFWYIPQTDVCVAIGSRVRLGATFDDGVGKDSEDDDWVWETKADANLTMSKMTDYGPLTTYISFDSGHQNGSGASNWVLDEAYFSFGPATIGYTGSVSNASIGYTDSDFKLIKADANTINLAFAVDGIGLFLGIENPQDRWGSSNAASVPDISLAIEAEVGSVALFGSALIAAEACNNDSAFAVAGTAETSFDMVDLQVGGMFGSSECGPSGGNGFGVQDGWAAGGSARVNWTDTFQTAGSVWWAEPDGGADSWGGAATLFFQPTDGMEIFIDAGFDEDGLGAIGAEVAVQLN